MTATANGHAPPPFTIPLQPRGPVSALPRHQPAIDAAYDHPSRTIDGTDGTAAPRRAVDGDMVIRVLAAAVVLAVAAFAAIVSYSHIFELGVLHHQIGAAARLLPLSVDGLIASASLVMLHAARRELSVPWLARAMLALGVGATVAANVGYGLPSGWLAAVVSAWPAVAFVGSVEMAVRFVRDGRQDTGIVQSAAAPVVPQHEDKQVDKPGPRRAIPARTALDKAADIIRRHPDWTDAAVAKSASVSTKTVQRARIDVSRAGS